MFVSVSKKEYQGEADRRYGTVVMSQCVRRLVPCCAVADAVSD